MGGGPPGGTGLLLLLPLQARAVAAMAGVLPAAGLAAAQRGAHVATLLATVWEGLPVQVRGQALCTGPTAGRAGPTTAPARWAALGQGPGVRLTLFQPQALKP
jgi:hypothetical protein